MSSRWQTLMDAGLGAYDRGDQAAAAKNLEEALVEAMLAFGQDHRSFDTTLNELAGFYYRIGDYARAEPLHRQLVEIRRRVLGEHHQDYATALNNMAELYRVMGQFNKAESLYRKTLRIKETLLGKEHPSYLRSLDNLAATYSSMQRYDQAECLFRESLNILSQKLGNERHLHFGYASALRRLAELYAKQGKQGNASPLFEEALTILKQCAESFYLMGEYVKAEVLQREMLHIRSYTVGEYDVSRMDHLSKLVQICRLMGEPARAEPYLRQAMMITEHAIEEDNQSILHWVDFLADIFHSNGEDEKAEALHRRASRIHSPLGMTINLPAQLAVPHTDNRYIRVFVSSTFRDMKDERNELMTHAWPELRRFCRERQVELVEVDLRWGIAEEQSTRKETLKLCLDEIRACRPFFIGLLGERYGWVPEDDAFTADLREEQPWLENLRDRSVTELEILHGVLNNPEMADRAFFYFRDPAYAQARGADFNSETPASAAKQTTLKTLIRQTCAAENIPLRDNYPDPRQLATLVLEDLKAAIGTQFPIESIPDPIMREARDHEAFAEIRRRTYIGRADYFEALDRHAMAGDRSPAPPSKGGEDRGEVGERSAGRLREGQVADKPLVLLGDSGSGKSALLANWIDRWRKSHPKDFIFPHYIGGTPDSAEHWRLMARLIAEVKHWSADPEKLPRSHDEILKTFPVWLAKARIRAERDGVRFIIVLDALNQLEDRDHARLLAWLPAHPFTGPLRLIVSTLPGDTLKAVEERSWPTLRVEPLTPDERGRMIAHYLQRFGKKFDTPRLERLASAPAAANPLYVKILLDELRITGTHDRLDERLADYLAAADIPALLKKVLARYQRDYERERPGLVSVALGLLWSARRGLTEAELLRLLKPAHLPQLPLAVWTPLRAALEEGLVDRGGILNFVHDFLRAAVGSEFVPGEGERKEFRLQLADYFQKQPASVRSCDELPWLLWQTESSVRLRACLLDIDCFLDIFNRDQDELRSYWVWLGEESAMGTALVAAFERWSDTLGRTDDRISYAADCLACFLNAAALHAEAETLFRRALAAGERRYGPDHPDVAACLHNLAGLLLDTNRMAEAEPLYRRALAIDERSYGSEHPNVAGDLNNLAQLLKATNRLAEAEPLYRRAQAIEEQTHGPDHRDVAACLNNLAELLLDTNRLAEAEPLFRRALAIDERSYGSEHPNVAGDLNNLAELLRATNRLTEAEPLYRRVLRINEQSYGPEHPKVASALNNLAGFLETTNQLTEAEPLYRRAVTIWETRYGPDHPDVAACLNNLAGLLLDTNRPAKAEPFYRRALAIDERSYGPEHPNVAIRLNNLAELLRATNRLAEAESLFRRALAIWKNSLGEYHPNVAIALDNLASLLHSTGRMAEAEPFCRRALMIIEQSYGPDHPEVAMALNALAVLLTDTNRPAEAEPLSRRHLEIFLKFTQTTGRPHRHLQGAIENYARLLEKLGHTPQQVQAKVNALTTSQRGLRPQPKSQ